MKYRVVRKNKGPVEVSIMYDRNTDKYCFVNLTHEHVCKCRFDSPQDALKDMMLNNEVAYFQEINE